MFCPICGEECIIDEDLDGELKFYCQRCMEYFD